MHADWSTVSRNAFDGSVLLTLRSEEDGVDLRVLEFDRAIAWALQRDTETRPTDLYKLECRRKPADIGSAERLDLDFRARQIKDAVHEGERYASYRWRGGFSIPNPFRTTRK
jgi:hypothetical protein